MNGAVGGEENIGIREERRDVVTRGLYGGHRYGDPVTPTTRMNGHYDQRTVVEGNCDPR